jgi:hypothetical protein
LYAGASWIGDHLDSLQRLHVELRLDYVNCVPNDGNSVDSNGKPTPVIDNFKRQCTVQVDIHNIGRVDFIGRGDALFRVCQSSPLRKSEGIAPPYIQISGPVKEEPTDTAPHIHT